MKDYSFGNYICALRTGLGLSQFQLGTLVGVTDKAVSKWENGDSKPRLATCNRLAEVLGVSVNELLSCKQYVTITARKEINKLNRKLWKQAYERLNIYGETPPIECWSRLAAEEAALQETDAIQGFALLGKIADSYVNLGDVLHFEEGLSSQTLRELAEAIGRVCGGRAAVFSGTDGNYGYCLALPGGDLRVFGKEMNAALNGRGGGKPEFQQGSLKSTRDEIKAFYDKGN